LEILEAQGSQVRQVLLVFLDFAAVRDLEVNQDLLDPMEQLEILVHRDQLDGWASKVSKEYKEAGVLLVQLGSLVLLE